MTDADVFLEVDIENELKNLKRRIKAQEKNGYFGYKIPKKPKNPSLDYLNKIENIGAKEIREGSKHFKSSSGQSVSRKVKEKETAQKRSESAKKSAQTRKQNMRTMERFLDITEEDIQDYKNQTYEPKSSPKYNPTERDIKTNNFLNSIRQAVPSDYFQTLKDILFKAPNRKAYWRGDPGVPELHQQNRTLLTSAINRALDTLGADTLYVRLKNSKNLLNLQDKIEQSLFEYKEYIVTEASAAALTLLSFGALSVEEYNDMVNEDDEI